MKRPQRQPAAWVLPRRRFLLSSNRHPTTRVVSAWPCREHFRWNLLRGRFDGRVPVTYAIVTTKAGYTSFRLPEFGHEVGHAEACTQCPNQTACQNREDLREFWLPPDS